MQRTSRRRHDLDHRTVRFLAVAAVLGRLRDAVGVARQPVGGRRLLHVEAESVPHEPIHHASAASQVGAQDLVIAVIVNRLEPLLVKRGNVGLKPLFHLVAAVEGDVAVARRHHARTSNVGRLFHDEHAGTLLRKARRAGDAARAAAEHHDVAFERLFRWLHRTHPLHRILRHLLLGCGSRSARTICVARSLRRAPRDQPRRCRCAHAEHRALDEVPP